MGGTFYAREAPHLPPLVDEGDHFEAGQPLFIIEVMKMFNKVLRALRRHRRREPDAGPGRPRREEGPGDLPHRARRARLEPNRPRASPRGAAPRRSLSSPDVPQGPDREPRRDRGARRPCVPRARRTDGGHLLRGRSRGAARAGRRRGARLRPGAGARLVPARRTHRRDRARVRGRRDPPRLRLPVRERRLRGALRGCRHRLDRPAGRRDPPDGRQGGGAPHHGAGRSRGRARRDRAAPRRRAWPPPRAASASRCS